MAISCHLQDRETTGQDPKYGVLYVTNLPGPRTDSNSQRIAVQYVVLNAVPHEAGQLKNHGSSGARAHHPKRLSRERPVERPVNGKRGLNNSGQSADRPQETSSELMPVYVR